MMRCIYCFRALPAIKRRAPDADPDVLTVRLLGDSSIIEIHWHMACADVDPLHAGAKAEADAGVEHKPAMADALGLPNGEDADDVTLAAYRELHRRAVATSKRPMRELIDVVADFKDLRITLRGPGNTWGIPSMRAPLRYAPGRAWR